MATLEASAVRGALCKDVSPREFFDDIWPVEDIKDDRGVVVDWVTAKLADPEALEKTRDAYCRGCPARRVCLEEVMGYEDGKDADRHGLCGYLTPHQRRSVKKRGALRCPGCQSVRDPVLLEAGIYRCPKGCGQADRWVDVIPIEGDQWSKRHTALARKVLSWIVDNVEVGEAVPPPAAMCETLACRRQDVGRVYAALVSDGTLDKDAGGYIRMDASTMRSRVNLYGAARAARYAARFGDAVDRKVARARRR